MRSDDTSKMTGIGSNLRFKQRSLSNRVIIPLESSTLSDELYLINRRYPINSMVDRNLPSKIAEIDELEGQKPVVKLKEPVVLLDIPNEE